MHLLIQYLHIYFRHVIDTTYDSRNLHLTCYKKHAQLYLSYDGRFRDADDLQSAQEPFYIQLTFAAGYFSRLFIAE